MIELVASAANYRVHAEPVMAALPADLRGPGSVALVASWQDHHAARARFRQFVVMEHGHGQSYSNDNPGYPGGARREADLFLAPNAHAAGRWQRAYPRARVEVVGSPRLDTLPARTASGPEPVVAIAFHWPCDIAPEARTTLPHYERGLAELARRFRVIGHAHPKGDWPARCAATFRRAGIEFVRDFDEVCRRADIYVCDNSSTIYEFASTGRNVVVMNAPWYRPSARHGLRFYDAADVGPQVRHPDELAAAIEQAIAGGRELDARREAALDIVYSYRSGAAARAAGVIEDWLRSDARIAA